MLHDTKYGKIRAIYSTDITVFGLNSTIFGAALDIIETVDFLSLYRDEIDQIDLEILDTIARRAKVVEKIAQYKKDHKMTILQVSRWDELLKDRLAVAKKLGLDDKFSKELYQQIHLMSIRIQTKVMNASKVKEES